MLCVNANVHRVNKQHIIMSFLWYSHTDVECLCCCCFCVCLQLREEEALSSLHEAVDFVLANILGDVWSVKQHSRGPWALIGDATL